MKKIYNVEEAKIITSKLVKKHGEDLKKELIINSIKITT